VKFIATGDSFITRTIPTENEAFKQVSDVIRKGDARFTNLEVTVHDDEGFPSAISGGTWSKAHPEVLGTLAAYGFNMMAWANNHTLDYSYGGLEATRQALERYDGVHAGAGRNLAEAAAPKYLECPSGRVAIIAATSTFHDCWSAGDQRPDAQGRPGINPLHFETRYRIDKEKLKALQEIAEVTGINARSELSEKEGYRSPPPSGTYRFGQDLFEASEVEGKVTIPNTKDIERLIRSVKAAAKSADYVMVSLHSHEMQYGDKTEPADFFCAAARACIDAGAHAILGHGPHILRGIEIYKKRPIFYSLGNFIFQNETVSSLPADFYTKYGLGHEHTVVEAFEARKQLTQNGLAGNDKAWKSAIAYWEMEEGELTKLQLYPVDLGMELPVYRRGVPCLIDATDHFAYLKELCAPWGTELWVDESGLIEIVL
jgi:poly-gamma-glutamate capsule biosynthesis protein CapA/YwtB (metallophosphatase superfamily)